MRTFSVQTLGCKVNQYESEQLAALLRARGLRPSESPCDADLRIINTCSVTTEAAAKSRQLARRASAGLGTGASTALGAHRKPDRAVVSLPQFPAAETPTSKLPIEPVDRGRSRVVVTGCWATSDRRVAEALVGVDAVIGHNQDVAAELIHLLDLWEGGAIDRQAAVEPSGIDGWMEKAGSPAGKSTNPITLSYESEVNEKIRRDVMSPGPAARRGTTSLPLLSSRQTGRQRAYLKIQDGCDAHCTYCIIPRLRPALWSKPIADVVAEANQLVAAGHVELVLTGIFLGAYGHPTALRRRRRFDGLEAKAPLARLTDALCSGVPGLKRLRFSSLEPGDLDAGLISALRSHTQVVPHFHLPLQSGSNALLRRMNRQYTRQDYLQMVDRVREAFDRPALTTDIIAGFPGETDADFERTLEVARHCRFIHIHAFPFSPRPGTAAARWTDQLVPGPAVNQRIAALQTLSEADSLAYRRRFIGQTVQVLVEREKIDRLDSHSARSPGPALHHGRCERYFPVHFHEPAARPGDLLPVRIDRIDGERTFGSRIQNPQAKIPI